MENSTRHMYQDGNDLVIVYTNVFNHDYNLEDFIRNEMIAGINPIPNLADNLKPVETVTPPKPELIKFGRIPKELYRKFLDMGGQSQNGLNYATSESLAQHIEAELNIKRISEVQ